MKALLISFFSLVLLCSSTSAKAEVNVQEFSTSKNIPVLYVEDNTTDLTTVIFAFKGTGSAYDPIGKEGLASMMTEMLFEQTKPGLRSSRHYQNI